MTIIKYTCHIWVLSRDAFRKFTNDAESICSIYSRVFGKFLGGKIEIKINKSHVSCFIRMHLTHIWQMFLMFVIFFNCLSSEWATTPHVSQKTNPWPKIHHKSTRYTFFKSLHPLELSIDIPYRENHWALIDEWLTTTGRFLSIMFGKSLSKLPHFSGLHHVPHFFRNVSYVHLMGIKVPVALLDYYDVLHFDPCVAGVTWVRGGSSELMTFYFFRLVQA